MKNLESGVSSFAVPRVAVSPSLKGPFKKEANRVGKSNNLCKVKECTEPSERSLVGSENNDTTTLLKSLVL